MTNRKEEEENKKSLE